MYILERHKLDEATDEILKHYGVEGMKWDVRRTPEQLEAARLAREAEDPFAATNAAIDKGNDFLEKFDALIENMEEFGEDFREARDKAKSKIDNIGDDIKKKGASVLTSIFGKGGDGKWKPAKPNKRLTEKFKQNVKDQTPNRMAAKAQAELSKMSKSEQRKAKKPVRKVYKNSRGPASRTEEVSITRKGFLGIPVTSTKKTTSYTTSHEKKR